MPSRDQAHCTVPACHTVLATCGLLACLRWFFTVAAAPAHRHAMALSLIAIPILLLLCLGAVRRLRRSHGRSAAAEPPSPIAEPPSPIAEPPSPLPNRR